MNCTICKLPTGNIVGSVLPQCKCGWQAPQPPVTQRTWVGLTNEEYKELHLQIGPVYYYQEYGQAIEAKLKEKNT